MGREIKEQASMADWLPTAENINALPQGLRDYIMGLETNCDPAGMVRENAILRHDNAEFESRLADIRTCIANKFGTDDLDLIDAPQTAG